MKSPLKFGSFKFSIGGAALFCGVLSRAAFAACAPNTAPASNTVVNCSGLNAPAVIAGPGSTTVTINIDPTASATFTHATNAVAYSVEQASAITSSGNLTLNGGGGTGTARGAVLLGTGNGNQLTNAAAGVIVTTGAFNDGMAANGSNNVLTNSGSITTAGPNAYGMTAAWGQTNVGQSSNMLINTGTVSTAGSNARAASILGGSGTIDNSGTLSTTGAASPTAYMQGNNDHLINTGTITAAGADSDAVFSNTAGSSFTALIENRTGGRIVSQNAAGIRTLNGDSTIINAGLVQSGVGTAIQMGNGDDALILQTGSVINGSADGGGGTNAVTLQGSGVASNAFMDFQSLLMEGVQWDWTGSGTFATAHVQTGTLNLVGALGASTAALVDAGAILQATAQTLPPNVTDNGLVRFAQAGAGTYTGSISGIGAVQKTGAGTVTLAPAAAGGNTYSGGTQIDGGMLSVAADNALGAASGGIVFDGGGLQLGQSFDLAGTRAITLNAGGGTIDTQSFLSTLSQPVSGAGGLTKTGAGGTLVLNGVNTYGGATNVAAGMLAIGDAAHGSAALNGGGATAVAAGGALGGYGSVNGAVTNSGTIAAANAVPAFAAAANGNFTINGSLVNAGLAQIGGRGVGNRLIVNGDYTGQNGLLGLNAVLAEDGAASDRLVLNGGTATGSTGLKVANIGGGGAQTTGDGIQVIQVNGGTSALSAFTLAAPAKAGAYSYYLAKGGVTPGSADNWYLRNTVAPLAAAVPIAAAGSPLLPAAPPAGSAPVPLYRPEVPIYSALPALAREIGIMQVDTFHERQGEQSLLTENGRLPAAWARVRAGRSDLSGRGTVNPSFDGAIYNMQVGQDIYADTTASGHRNHYGLFGGFARATGDVRGFALGTQDLDAGHLAINAYSIGAYWTHVGPGGWYTDTVLMGSSLTVEPRSRDGVAATAHGNAMTGSIEGGLPIALGARVTIEPQAQLIWQHLSINDLDDGASTVAFNNGNTLLGRIGVRLRGRFDAAGTAWEPWLRLNVLRTVGSDDKATYSGATVIGTDVGGTAGQVGAGVSVKVGKTATAFATASWLTNLGGAYQRTVMGNAGVRWVW